MQMQKTRMVIKITIFLLMAATIYLSVECFLLATELKNVKVGLNAQETNTKVAFFAKLFVDKILSSTGTVSFEDRLQLENAVRDLADPEIFAKWEQFTASNGDAESQQIAGSILKLLINRIFP